MNKLVVWQIYLIFWWKKKHEKVRDDVLRRAARRYWFRVDWLIKFGLFATFAFFALLVLFASGDTCGVFVCENRFAAFLKAPANEVGDTLAGIAGGLAFLWLVVTVLLQGKELAAQREELRLTRLEMRGQKEATKALANTSATQNFDNFVFEMITSLNSIVNSLDIRKADGQKEVLHQGRDCFGFFYKKFSKRPKSERMFPETVTQDTTLERYEVMFGEHSSDLSHYFRYVYNMLRVLDESEEVQSKHRKLVRSHFSDDELLVIFYNALTERGKNFLPFLESFELFDNLPIGRLVKPEHKDRFSPKCYGEVNA